MSIQSFFDRYVPPLEAEMQAIVQTAGPHYADFFGMLHYHLGWANAEFNPCQAQTGKRVRPVLCLLACEACGGDWEQGLPAGAAIELMHNFTLIHDDIEDRDLTRRGRPTVWSVWGEALAINVGDALFALTQLALLRLAERGVPATAVISASRLLNQTCVAITCGQHLDIGFESRSPLQNPVSTGEYLKMIEGKTAAMIACACELGSLVANADPSARSRLDTRCEHLRSFGHHLGMAFQMRDDVLGIWGNSDKTGKPVGSDIARRKKSLPILHGAEQSPELRALLAQEAISEAHVRHVTELLEGTGSREYTERLAQEHHNRALAALEEANLQGDPARALHELAQTLLNRER
jgi:geranylgeranyl diphosphate synthase type I